MTKIVKIRLENFKAIDVREMTFNGCSAIINGANNSGKTSFLRGLPDRIRFHRPQIKVKQGESEGFGELVLDNGDRFVWVFDDEGRDKLTFISKEGVKSNVTTELGRQFFPPLFDIDVFLQSTPKDQVKQLQKIVGLDFVDVDKRIDEAYKYRYKCNEEAERYRVKLSKLMKCDPVKPVDVEFLNIKRREAKEERAKESTRLNELYTANKKKNDQAIAAWEHDKKVIDEHFDLLIASWEETKIKVDNEIFDFNRVVQARYDNHKRAKAAEQILIECGYDGGEVSVWAAHYLSETEKSKNAFDFYPEKPVRDDYPERPETPDPMPSRDELDAIDKKIESIDAEILEATETNVRATKYQEYVDYLKEVKEAETAAVEADAALQKINDEKKEMIASAQFPEGISISSDPLGITVDGFPLDRSQLSTSKLYTAALRIASMNLGEVRTLYFDASFLDRNSLQAIYEWAAAHDLQLLIERPDYDGGEIEYQLIEG